MPDHNPWVDRLRERLAAEGAIPSAHAEAIDEIADHLDDLHRTAVAEASDRARADAIVEAELARIGPLAAAVAERAGRRSRSHPHGADWRAGLVADFRHAVRTLRIDRGFAATVIATLAIGIGSCTAVFSIINSLLLSPLPYPEPDRLVLMWESDANDRTDRFVVAPPVYDDWRREVRTLDSLGIFEYRTFNVASAADPEQVAAVRASASLFTVLGVPPALGRVFTADEDAAGHKVAVISDGVWRAHLGAQPSALGQMLRLNGEHYQVIGVMPRSFTFPRRDNGVWVPMSLDDRDRTRDFHSFHVAARLERGVTFDAARAEVEQVGRALAQRYEENRDEGSTITLMADTGIEPLRSMLMMLMGAVTLVLVIACVNVANLQLGRAVARRREFVVRLSLGAGLGRLARQLFAESLVLAGCGAIGGILLAWVASRTADLILAPGFRLLPFRGEMPIVIDEKVLLFGLAAGLLSAAVFGFAPLIGLRRREPQALLREGDRGSTGIASFTRRALVSIEVALAIIVLSGSGLLIKSLSEVLQVHPGLDPRDVLTLQVSLPQPDTYGPPRRETFCADLSRGAEGHPGIRTIGATSHLPLSGANAGRALTIEGRAANPEDGASAAYRLTCPGYFAALGIPLVEGRDFTHGDVTRGAQVTIVNRATAGLYWPGASPIGRRLKLGDIDNDQPWRVVVGVVENARHFGLDSEVRREFYVPYAQSAWPVMTVVAKTAGEPMLWQTALRDVITRVDPQLPVARMRSMDSVVASSVDWRATPMRLLTGFGIVGLLLASLGVYGVLAYYVSLRAREIGVRAALGATRGQLAALVVRQSVLPILAGVALGVTGSMASGRLLQELLYQVRPGDPQVTAVIVALLTAVGLLASWLPARRAASIDPMIALRDE
jgi:putative ABC transport system permease protein